MRLQVQRGHKPHGRGIALGDSTIKKEEHLLDDICTFGAGGPEKQPWGVLPAVTALTYYLGVPKTDLCCSLGQHKKFVCLLTLYRSAKCLGQRRDPEKGVLKTCIVKPNKGGVRKTEDE